MRIKYDVSAKNITTYGGLGVLKKLYLPETVDEFVGLIESEQNVCILGGGSNTIIPDGSNHHTVVSTKALDGIMIDNDMVVAEAGVMVSRLVKECRLHGLGGLEFLAGVPATVGGAVCMNAGAFGQETGFYVSKMTILTPFFGLKEICAPFDFDYRKGPDGVIVDVTFHLEKMTHDTSVSIEKRCVNIRRQTQPRGRSVGCTFKNVGLGAGYYIDKAGLKGCSVGGAEISTKHANFIVNKGDGSASDFLALVDLAKTRVYDCFGVHLEKEFILLGEI